MAAAISRGHRRASENILELHSHSPELIRQANSSVAPNLCADWRAFNAARQARYQPWHDRKDAPFSVNPGKGTDMLCVCSGNFQRDVLAIFKKFLCPSPEIQRPP